MKLLNMSIAASWLVLAVLILRLLLKKTPKWITCLLWGLVALRLIVPFYIESGISLIPSSEVFPEDIIISENPAIHSGISVVNSTVNSAMTQQMIEKGNSLDRVISVLAIVWAVGAVVMLLYGTISGLRLRRKLRASILIRDRVYICDEVASPFVFGFFRPKIYMPSGIEESQLPYILAHENAHIRRLDHWWKPISFGLLAIYWFNPLLWVAHILLCRDIERACDEKVVADMDNGQKKGYSQALVACSVHRRMIMTCPVAFGEIGVKTRVKGVFSYKKPALWLMITSVAACTAVAACFLTNPKACSHEYQSQVIVASTCTQKGMENHTCQLCNYSYAAPVEMCAHTYDEGVVLQASTCVEQGVKELTCMDCGAKKTEPIALTAHIDGEHIISVEPHCSQEGQVTTTCTYCQASYVVEILPANDVHDLQETVVKASTCTEKGEGIRQCTRCDYQETLEYELLEHSYYTLRTWQSDCLSDREMIQVCSVCQKTHTIRIPAKGEHTWGNDQRCIVCGAVRLINSDSASSKDLFDAVVGNLSQLLQWPDIVWNASDSTWSEP